ncbi:hypothetical protein Tco_0674421 [Tanacetum coccineum]
MITKILSSAFYFVTANRHTTQSSVLLYYMLTDGLNTRGPRDIRKGLRCYDTHTVIGVEWGYKGVDDLNVEEWLIYSVDTVSQSGTIIVFESGVVGIDEDEWDGWRVRGEVGSGISMAQASVTLIDSNMDVEETVEHTQGERWIGDVQD